MLTFDGQDMIVNYRCTRFDHLKCKLGRLVMVNQTMMVNFGQTTWSTGHGWSTDSKLMQNSQRVKALVKDATQSTLGQQKQLVNIDCQHTLSTLIVNKYRKRMVLYEKLTTFVNWVKDICGVKGVE